MNLVQLIYIWYHPITCLNCSFFERLTAYIRENNTFFGGSVGFSTWALHVQKWHRTMAFTKLASLGSSILCLPKAKLQHAFLSSIPYKPVTHLMVIGFNHPRKGLPIKYIYIYIYIYIYLYYIYIYIYGGCPKLLFPQRPLGPSLRQPCAFLARPHSRITFIISVVFHHYSRTCFRMLNI